jgi:hypothetical protein
MFIQHGLPYAYVPAAAGVDSLVPVSQTSTLARYLCQVQVQVLAVAVAAPWLATVPTACEQQQCVVCALSTCMLVLPSDFHTQVYNNITQL